MFHLAMDALTLNDDFIRELIDIMCVGIKRILPENFMDPHTPMLFYTHGRDLVESLLRFAELLHELCLQHFGESLFGDSPDIVDLALLIIAICEGHRRGGFETISQRQASKYSS